MLPVVGAIFGGDTAIAQQHSHVLRRLGPFWWDNNRGQLEKGRGGGGANVTVAMAGHMALTSNGQGREPGTGI